ncbi:MAG: HEAT repeat domain-containing protein, partial [Planctomycetota bacterium]|nr:HEAT repeat domain-containing protein [Planctomycetota bacterium]
MKKIGCRLSVLVALLIFGCVWAMPLFGQTPAEEPKPGEEPTKPEEPKTGEEPAGPVEEEPAGPSSKIIVFAQHFAREGKNYFTVQGEAEYVDRTIIAVTLYLRKRRTELSVTTRIANKRFEMSIETDKKLFPGYYEVRAAFHPYLQQDPDLLDLQMLPAAYGTFSVRIGTEEEIVAAKKELIKFYQAELDKVRKTYNRMRDVYIAITRTKKFDIASGSKEWSDLTEDIIKDFDKDVRAYRTAWDAYVVPVFPQLHSCITDMQGSLLDVTGDMSFAIATDLAKEGAHGKVITHEDVLNACDRLMNAMLDSVDAQLLLEQEEELRDLLLNQIKQVAWLIDFSEALYDKSVEQKKSGGLNAQTWIDALTDWRARAKGLNDAIMIHKGTELDKRNKRGMKVLFDMPEKLEAMWRLFDADITDGTDVAERLEPIRNQIHNDISDIINTFEFRDELGPGGRWPGLRELAVSNEGQLKSQAAQCFIELNSKDDNVRLVGLKKLAGMPTELVIDQISQGSTYGEPLLQTACVILVGLHGRDGTLDKLGKLLVDEPNQEFRAFVVRAIGRVGKVESIPALGQALLNDKSEVVRGMCADTLGQYQSKAVVDHLIKALDDADASVRARVYTALQAAVADINSNLV